MKSDTSVSGQSFKPKKKRREDEEYALHRPRASRVYNRVQRAKDGAAKKSGGKPLISKARPRRPSPRGPALKEAARRCVVKTSYVSNRKQGQWAAHGSYLEREGAQKEGEKGHGFDAQTDDVSLKHKMHAWQMAGDPRLFKIVLSPEDGDRLNLREYTREFMQRLEPHVGRDLEWSAIEHYNTGQPHVHVVLRGKDNLQISPDLVRHGMRHLAEEIATERLGYKSQLEMQKAREKEIEAKRFTAIDKDIQKRLLAGPDGQIYVTESRLPKTAKHEQMVAQRLRIQRLEALEKMGLTEKVGAMTWQIERGFDKSLKDLQVLQTRTALVAQGRALMTDPRCPPVVTKVKPGDLLVGRVLGTGLDEQYDRSFVLIEGVDSRAHIVYQNNAIEKERADRRLEPRTLVAIQGKSFEKDGKTIAYTNVLDYGVPIPDKGFDKVAIPEPALDAALDAGMQPDPDRTTGFQRIWHERLLARQRERERERLKKEKEAQKQKQVELGRTKARGKGQGIGD
ncbi:DUF3363 domain-containing protein [Acidithiobacillus caldus]|uniref:DUF3363 domain-containing protein n=1 Tax=Acidithiobacillus caldus TaxID=33059 RepID=UPI0007F54EA0|nr:DUF3363 domain-containing protein [Acidithiobacillus caldus]QER46012.1 Type IV secretory pathway, VirD2 component [Acidithiobacillus caldus]